MFVTDDTRTRSSGPPAAAAVAAALDALDAIDVSSCDAGGLAEVTILARRLGGCAGAVLAKVAVRAAELHAAGAPALPTDVLTTAGRLGAREAARVVRRGEVLSATPTLAAALSEGSISADHADALANATAKLHDDAKAAVLAHDAELARAAGRLSPERFAVHCRHLAAAAAGDDGLGVFERQRRQTSLRRWIDDASGMYRLEGALDPITGRRLWTALDHEVDAMRAEGRQEGVVEDLAPDNQHLAAHALVDLVSAGHRERRPAVAEIAVHIDLETLVNDLAEVGVCELSDGTRMPAAVARRLACDAGLLPVVLGGDGVALDVGRSRRLATTAQRRALRAMYDTCAFGCPVPFDRCEIHHLTPWAHGGRTDLDGLVPACTRHHHEFHERGWTAQLDEHRTLHLHRPDGALHACHPLPSFERGRRRRPQPPERQQGPPDVAHGESPATAAATPRHATTPRTSVSSPDDLTLDLAS